MDELCSHLGYVVSEMRDYPILDDLRLECEEIQQHLFDCGSDLATPRNCVPTSGASQCQLAGSGWMNICIFLRKSTALSFGRPSVASLLHVARTMTRRLERRMVAVIEAEEAVNEVGLIYINRLSDYFCTGSLGQ